MVDYGVPGRSHPWEKWNAFVELLAKSEYAALSDAQRPAHLAFRYDSEVQNGGHLQYFLNTAGSRASEAVAALQQLGATSQADILQRALVRWQSRPRAQPEDPEQYVETALEGEFDDLNLQYYEASPTITEILQDHLDRRESDFLEYVDDT